MPLHLEVGICGEEIAARYLEAIGYAVRGRRIRLGKDEIDILAFDPYDNVLVFAEVKSRAVDSPDFLPELNATFGKKQKLFRSARRWVTNHQYEGGYRIDLISVAGEKVIGHVKEMTREC